MSCDYKRPQANRSISVMFSICGGACKAFASRLIANEERLNCDSRTFVLRLQRGCSAAAARLPRLRGARIASAGARIASALRA